MRRELDAAQFLRIELPAGLASQCGGGSVDPASGSRFGCSTALRMSARYSGSRSFAIFSACERPMIACHEKTPAYIGVPRSRSIGRSKG